MQEYVANLHVHSTYSDGQGTVEKIIASAQRAGIDVIGLTDHRTLAAYREGYEGWHGNVLLIVGMENNREYNHYLSWGITREVQDNTEKPQRVIEQVVSQGGIGFLAHPVETGSPLIPGKNAFPWIDWSVSGFTGICIWNYSSQFRDGATTYPQALYQAYLNPHHKITGPWPETMRRWDEACQTRRVVAIGGSDAHAFKARLGPLEKTVFPYEFLFRCVNTHLLIDSQLERQPELAKQQFVAALREGSCFIAFDYYYPSRGFRFWAERGSAIINMGQEAPFQPATVLRTTLPRHGWIRLLKDGRLYLDVKAREMEVPAREHGVYRLEVYHRRGLGWRPWIYSNPVYLRP